MVGRMRNNKCSMGKQVRPPTADFGVSEPRVLPLISEDSYSILVIAPSGLNHIYPK